MKIYLRRLSYIAVTFILHWACIVFVEEWCAPSDSCNVPMLLSGAHHVHSQYTNTFNNVIYVCSDVYATSLHTYGRDAELL
jgi:hypothetical protein